MAACEVMKLLQLLHSDGMGKARQTVQTRDAVARIVQTDVRAHVRRSRHVRAS